MAEKLPQFESTVTVQPGPLVSEAPSFEAAAKVAGNLSDMVDKNLQRKADQQAVAQGGIAGENLAFQPAKGGGRAAEIYNQAALAANKYTLAADIGTKMQNLTGELSQNVNGNETLDEFRARAQGYGEGLLSNIPKANEPYAKNLLQAHANAGLTKLQGLVNKQNNEHAFVGFTTNFDTLKAQVGNFSRQGNGKMALGADAIAKHQIEDGIKAGWLTAAQAAGAKKSLHEELYNNRALFKYELAQKADKAAIAAKEIPNNRKRYREIFKKTGNKVYTPEQKEALLKKFDAMDKEEAAKDGINEQNYAEKVKTAIFQKAHGVNPSAESLFDIQTLKPNQYANFEKQLEFAGRQSSIVDTAQAGNIGTMQSTIDELNKPLTTAEIASPNVLTIQATKKAASDRLQTSLKLVKDDPVTFVKSTPAYQKEINEVVQKSQAHIQLDPRIPDLAKAMDHAKATAALQAETDLLMKHQVQLGVAPDKVRALDNATRDLAINEIKSTPVPDDQVSAVKSILSPYSEDQQATVLRDLQDKDKLPQSTQYLMRISNNADSRHLQSSANIAFQHKIADYKDVLQGHAVTPKSLMQLINNSDTAQKYQDVLANMGGDTTNVYNDYANKVQLLTAQLISEGQTPSDAIDKATNALMAGVQFGSDKGQTYQFPETLNQSHLSNAIHMMKEEAINTPLHIPDHMMVNLPPSFREVDSRGMLIATSHFATSPDQRSLTLVDQHGTTIKTKDGKVFKLPFDDLQKTTSVLSQNVYKYEAAQKARFFEKLKVPTKVSEILEHRLQKVVSDNVESQPELEKLRKGSVATPAESLLGGLFKPSLGEEK